MKMEKKTDWGAEEEKGEKKMDKKMTTSKIKIQAHDRRKDEVQKGQSLFVKFNLS